MSHNDKKIYVIRNLGFMYDDEYYFILIPPNIDEYAGQICAVFENREMARQKWKSLEYHFSHEVDFENVTGFEGSYYVLEQLGFDLNNIEEKIKRMNQDELFDLIQKLDRHVFYIYEYSADLKIKTLFNLAEKTFDFWDASTDYLSNNFLKTDDEISMITINGTLEELSDAPSLLSQLIHDNPSIKYNEENRTLEIAPDEKTLNSVNALLKNPLYEIRYLTIQEIYEIEQKLNPTDSQDA